jgi:hypothetical protein
MYCSRVDINHTAEERKYIRSKIDPFRYRTLLTEFEKDTDYTALEKLNAFVQKHNMTEQTLDSLFKEIKQMFLFDGKRETMEYRVQQMLHKILTA